MTNENLDDLYKVTGEDQDAIDKMEADPWALRPDKDGKTPKDLIPNLTPELDAEGYAERWYQDEQVECKNVRVSTHEFEGGGHSLELTLEAIDPKSPNKGKQIPKRFYLYLNDAERTQRAKGDLYNNWLKPLGMSWVQQSPAKTAEALKGRRFVIRLGQAWQHPWDAQKRAADTSKPKKFTKRIVEVKKLS